MAVPADQQRTLAEAAEEASRKLDSAEPQEILSWALDTFGKQFCIAASMADAVLIDMASRLAPDVDVIFLETGYHFADTLATRDAVMARYPVRVHSILPKQTVAEQDELFGPRLHDRDPDACCNLRKVEPLRRSLDPYAAWASGIRRDETQSRRSIGVVEWDANRAMVKVNPLAGWKQGDVEQYIADHDVVVNPLLSQGYPSIGCAPCTRRVAPGEPARSGRWAGTGKTECGLHLGPDGRLTRVAR